MYKFYDTNGYGVTSYIRKSMAGLWQIMWNPSIRKWLMRINLTCLILLIAFMQVSLAANAQKISLSKKNAPLTEVFRELKKQSGYGFMINREQLKMAKPVTINASEDELEKVLDKCFEGQPFTYKLEGKMIVVVDKKQELTKIDLLQIEVKGRIVDEKGEPIAGATVKVKGTNNSTSSNGEGVFTLKNVNEGAILEISYLGFQPREVKASKDLGSVKLELAVGKLDEVTINAGYYTVKDRERTGSISKVTAETIGRQPVNNPLMALVGNVPGLQVTQSNGVPGGGFTVRVRGQNSINSGNDPLYIVDGVNYPSSGISSNRGSLNSILGTGGANPLSLINPNDIESIEVLKDADATAIYGSRGANGVILITTKRGKQGVTTANAKISHGFSEVGHKVKLLNTEEYLQMRREAYFTNDKLTTSSPAYASQFDINGTWDQNKYTDWQELLIGSSAPISNASLDIAGGNTKSNYLIAGNYLNEKAVSPGDFGFQRYGLRSNVNFGDNEDRFNASFTVNLSRTESDLMFSSLANSILVAPNAPDPYDEFGKLNWANGTYGVNPFQFMLQPINSKNDNLIVNTNLSYRILNNLVLRTSLGYNTIRRNEFRKEPLSSFDPSLGATGASRRSYFGNNYSNTLTIEPQLSYNLNIASGKLNALVGASVIHNDSQLNVLTASNFTSDDLLENMASAVTLVNEENSFVRYRYAALYGRINYTYDDRYLINLTARRDGSSRFGPGKQFANFGAIGAGWIFSEESLIKEKLPFISFGKFRGSYGITGNDQIQDYRYLQLWNPSAVYAGSSTFTPDTSPPNADFAWETNRKLEAAIQLGLFKDRITFEASWFRNRSSNQLIFETLPRSTGQLGVYANLPAVVQNSGWEFNSKIDIFRKQGLDWSIGFNLTIPQNKLLSFDNLSKSGYASRFEIGQPLNILKAYNVTVDLATGSYVVEDKNGSKTIDVGDQYVIKFLGQKSYGGIQNSIKYKHFNLDFLFTFAKQLGKGYMSSTLPGRFSAFSNTNQFAEVLGRWQGPLDITSIAKYSTTTAASSLYSQVATSGNLSIVDASYIRLRNISLSYDLPAKLLSKLKVQNASINFQGQNLYTFTNYIGLDPESGALNLPLLRTITLGLNVNF